MSAFASTRRWFVPEVVQTSSMDCGPATLKCVLEGFRIPVSYGRLRDYQTGIDGTSIDTLEEVANRLGVSATQSLLPVDHLFIERQTVFPAIVVVRLGDGATHFVVVWSRHGDWLQVMDPSLGRRWVKASALANDLLRHEASVPAAAWRDWAVSESFLVPLAERFARLGGSDADFARLVAIATADPARIRLRHSMRQSGWRATCSTPVGWLPATRRCASSTPCFSGPSTVRTTSMPSCRPTAGWWRPTPKAPRSGSVGSWSGVPFWCVSPAGSGNRPMRQATCPCRPNYRRLSAKSRSARFRFCCSCCSPTGCSRRSRCSGPSGSPAC